MEDEKCSMTTLIFRATKSKPHTQRGTIHMRKRKLGWRKLIRLSACLHVLPAVATIISVLLLLSTPVSRFHLAESPVTQPWGRSPVCRGGESQREYENEPKIWMRAEASWELMEGVWRVPLQHGATQLTPRTFLFSSAAVTPGHGTVVMFWKLALRFWIALVHASNNFYIFRIHLGVKRLKFSPQLERNS